MVVAPNTSRGWRGERLGAFVDALLADPLLRLDPARTYCTGVSMGGYGCWVAVSGQRYTAAFSSSSAQCGGQANLFDPNSLSILQ